MQLLLWDEVAKAWGLPQMGGSDMGVEVLIALVASVADPERSARVISWAWAGEMTNPSRGIREEVRASVQAVLETVHMRSRTPGPPTGRSGVVVDRGGGDQGVPRSPR